MLGTLVKKEIVGHVLSLRFTATLILLLILVCSGFYVTTDQYLAQRDQYFIRQRASDQHLESILAEDRDWRLMDRLFHDEGRELPVPVSPLSAIAEGLAAELPAGVRIMAERWENVERSTSHNPLEGLIRTTDLAYVVGIVLSLLAVLFAFDAVCGEKESGTLRLTLSNAVPRHTVLVAKWIGGGLVLLVPFLLAALGGIAYAWARGAVAMTGEQTARILLLLGAAGLYVSAVFTMGLFLSARTHRATTALFCGLLAWVVWILVVPNLAPVMAKVIAPTPSPKKIAAEKTAIDEEIELRKQRLSLTGALGYAEETERKAEELDQEGRQRKARWDRFLEKTARRQSGLAGTFARLSPAASWTFAAAELTQTGQGDYRRFESARRKAMEAMTTKQEELDGWWHEPDGLREIRPDELPNLNLSHLHLAAALPRTINDMLLLVIWNVVFFLAAFVSFLKYDVR